MDGTSHQTEWIDEAERFIESYDLTASLSTEKVQDMLFSRTASWKTTLPDGFGFHFLKLRVPVVEREEVLTGNLLFGDFVRKCALEALNQNGEAIALTGDLDDAYYLAVSRKGVEELALAVRERVEARLAELFFGGEYPERGIHGEPENMFRFVSSFIEPYPVFSVPSFLAENLYETVVEVLSDRIENDPLVVGDNTKVTWQLRNIQATFAFFFGRTADNKGDVPGFAGFLFRLVSVYGILEEEEIVAALKLTEFDKDSFKKTKDSIKDAFDNATVDEEKIRDLFRKLLRRLQQEKAADAIPGESWFLPYIRESEKLLDASQEEYLDCVLDGSSLGFAPLGTAERGEGLVCRVCGAQVGPVGEKNILLGISVGKFHNQSGSIGKGARICPRCALFSFLNTKLFGMTSAGKFPVPSKENLIFHYGNHTEDDVQRLDALANKTLDLTRQFAEIRRTVSEENRKLKEAERTTMDASWQKARLDKLASDESSAEDKATIRKSLVELLFDKPGVEQVVSQMRTNGEIRVFSLGAGSQRLVIFALPHFRDELELAHRRFSRSRSVVVSLMAFLSGLCGCDGPFFFQGKPRLEDSGSRGVFYIRDRAYDSERYRRLYETLSNFAHRAVGGAPSDALKGRLKLAVGLEEAPLATFDSVLRASPIRPGEDTKDAKYRRVVNSESGRYEYDEILKVYSPWEYLKVFEEMRKLEREEAQRVGNR
jgi:hypothetical protein